ncbi:MAG: BON domain-containing protein [Rhizobacter sp.]
MKTDEQLRKDVLAELEWDPAVNAAHVGVAAKDGVVTLTGHLETFAEKHAVERVVQRVKGVRAVAVELDVRLDPAHKRSDSEIAAAVNNVLAWHSLVPHESIRAKVEKGWVTLAGEVEWNFQRHHAEKAVRSLTGVLGVNNTITLKARAVPANVAERIREAMTRHAEREARHIEVIADGSLITLRGTVDSWSERAAAYGAAASAPGVTQVINEIRVET